MTYSPSPTDVRSPSPPEVRRPEVRRPEVRPKHTWPHRAAYASPPCAADLLSTWNLLDLFIVSVSLISLCPAMERFAVLRLLRVLRPLRLLSRIEGMKVIFAFFAEAWQVRATYSGLRLDCG